MTTAVADGDEEVGSVFLVAVVAAPQQQIGEAQDGIERRTNFVAHIGQEFALSAIGRVGGTACVFDLRAAPLFQMELVGYSIAMSRSLLLIHKIIKKIPIKNDYKIIGIEVGIVVGLLLAGGFLEAYLIDTIEVPII
jgi:hypothetical protein